MDDYLEDSIHPDSGLDFENWLDSTARNLLQKLGCHCSPVLPAFFQPWLGRNRGDLKKKAPTLHPRGNRQRGELNASQESDSLRNAAKLAGANFLRVFGPKVRSDSLPAVLDHLALEILAPKTWLEECWGASQTLQAIAAHFPGLWGENLALRLARFWHANPSATVAWFQGGQRIWTCRGGCKSYRTPLSDLEMAAWTGTREYSRPVHLREPAEEAHGFPFHSGFPKGEVVVHFQNGFPVQIN
jgi:hypothetical protein